MEPPVLEVRDLRVGFADDRGRVVTAVDGVSFAVRRGRMLGLVGESGSGKSVTAFSLMRLLPRPAGRVLGGSIRFNGRELTTLPDAAFPPMRGREMAMVFQEPMTALNPIQTLGRQLAEVYALHTNLSGREIEARCVESLRRVGIPDPQARLRELPGRISGGMRQRVVIAMALALTPALLICDEPTTALDVTIQAQILELIRERRREAGLAGILITHDLGVVAENCEDVAVMYAGRIVERGPVEAVFGAPAHAYTRALLATRVPENAPRKSRLASIPGVVPGLTELRAGCRFAPRSGLAYTEADLDERPPEVEIAPGHFVEASRVCAPAAAWAGRAGR